MRWWLGLLLLVACHLDRPPVPLITKAEASHWIETGRYDEVIALCRGFAATYDGVRCEDLGKTGEGRPIVALNVARAPGKPTLWIEGGIHAGEIEGKDAGLWFLRDLLDGKVAPGALAAVNVIFVPVLNPDGHERFGPANRPNQRGPVAMGFRTNGARENLNRDFVKAETPEIRALLRRFLAVNPVVFVDIHTTDGAMFEHDVSVTVAPRAPRPDGLDRAALALGDELAARLTERGHLPVTFYPSFVNDDDPSSGFAIAESPPRFSNAYAAARSRIGILVENHSWRPYEHRVRTTYDFLRALFELAAREAPAWTAAEARAGAADLGLGGGELPVAWENGPHVTSLSFRGYAYEREPSEISGGTWTKYDETRPQTWQMPLRDELVAKTTVRVPRAGYIVDGGYAARVADVLDAHGVRYERLAGTPRLAVDAYRATRVTPQPLFEGHARLALEGAWARETRTLDRGALFVPVRQPGARVIVQLFDPAAPDSLAQWGIFATPFERKEYMEAYVAEEAARAMLAAQPGLRAQFDAALAADPELAKDPAKRLEWFYRRHPAWDERTNLWPIYRADEAPVTGR
jgi:hypothetical protein